MTENDTKTMEINKTKTSWAFFVLVAIGAATFIFGLAVSVTESMRLSILLLCLFFFASFIVLSFMKKTKYVK